MIDCKSIQHVSISVTDLARAKEFYAQVLGLREIPRPAFDFPGAWYAIGGQQLHLIVYPVAQTLRRAGGIDTRDGHFAARVADFDEAIRHLQACGVPYRENRHSVTGWQQAFVCDPDGNVIELNAERVDG